MPKLAANLHYLFAEVPFLDRFAMAAAAGFAGVPGRNEPDVGEIHYPYLFDLMDQLGYQGWVGCEYKPLRSTREGLGWAKPYGIRAEG